MQGHGRNLHGLQAQLKYKKNTLRAFKIDKTMYFKLV